MKSKRNLPELLIKELEERGFLQLENKVSRQFHHAVTGHAVVSGNTTCNTADAVQKEAGENEFLIYLSPIKGLEHQMGCQ